MEEFEECVHDDLINSNTVDDLESNEEPIVILMMQIQMIQVQS